MFGRTLGRQPGIKLQRAAMHFLLIRSAPLLIVAVHACECGNDHATRVFILACIIYFLSENNVSIEKQYFLRFHVFSGRFEEALSVFERRSRSSVTNVNKRA